MTGSEADVSDAGPLAQPQARTRLLAGLGWAALAVAIFSGWFIVTRFGVTHDLAVWDVIALRFGGGALLLGPLLLTRRHRLPAGAWLEGLLFALLWGAPFVLFVALGLQLTSAAQASSVTPALMPVFAGLVAWLALREPPGRGRLFGYLAIVAGVAALAVGQARGSAPSPLGLASLLAAALLWALYTLRFRRGGISPLQSAALICLWSALLYLPAYLLGGLSRLGTAPAGEVAFQVLYQGLLMSAVAIVAFNRAVTLLGPRSAAAIIALIPVAATTLAIPALGEVPSRLGALAIVVIASGVLLAARPARLARTS
ncbi:Threonine/homoserine efflux transporter RhtA [Tistlia consotensis]|uniref:Threonine/homoserine efflux transporter RhtA n=1 Tax=Tistlia consotensis USBA 355 TaxID=560819 RepID=A0A1Y6B542_9PROT|nr:DMT family transporter [Tistlia consotensis]SME92728.1 Threonine/homoserine efflux transporter RhtA [Tistlia consotensis USBA 355]SNR28205.1 Threonine/homoserine efflux transporter RhtA [Tistlia consotensis]